jgi:Flp pilus assembly protein TadG
VSRGLAARRPRADRDRERDSERGSMAIEVVILIPIVLLFTMLVVAAGRFADVHGRVDAVTRDAVRAASDQRSYSDALAAAQQIAAQTQPTGKGVSCTAASLTGSFTPGSTITVTMSCTFSLGNLGLPVFEGKTVTIGGASSAPLDIYRRS